LTAYENANPQQHYGEAFSAWIPLGFLAVKRTHWRQRLLQERACLLHGGRFQSVIDPKMQSRGFLSIQRRPNDLISRTDEPDASAGCESDRHHIPRTINRQTCTPAGQGHVVVASGDPSGTASAIQRNRVV
jgi:hypothetical protein